MRCSVRLLRNLNDAHCCSTAVRDYIVSLCLCCPIMIKINSSYLALTSGPRCGVSCLICGGGRLSEAVTAEVRSTWAPTLELSPGDMAMGALYLHNISRSCPRPGPPSTRCRASGSSGGTRGRSRGRGRCCCRGWPPSPSPARAPSLVCDILFKYAWNV